MEEMIVNDLDLACIFYVMLDDLLALHYTLVHCVLTNKNHLNGNVFIFIFFSISKM